jgi:hypothetical protein
MEIYILLGVIGFLSFILGIFACPLLLFLRARQDDAWDDSNMTNMLRLFAHIVTHPSDFGKMKYDDGSYPFWYINKDEFSNVVKTRPKDN